MLSWEATIEKRLNSIYPRREFRPKTRADSHNIIFNSRAYSNWVSNDYLGLSIHSEVIKAYQNAALDFGVGSTGAPSLCGNSIIHEQLCCDLAAWLNSEKCLLFNSGYQLAVGIYSQLGDTDTILWLDKNLHASHIDGVLLSKRKFVQFNAATIEYMISTIKAQPDRLHIIITEAVFSMDGSCTYLDKLVSLKQQTGSNVMLVVDDAHGLGALGEHGLNVVNPYGMGVQGIDILIGTLGKAFGCHGGFIAGSTLIIDFLQQTTRSLLFSTYLPAGVVAGALCSLNIIRSNEGQQLRKKLKLNICYFKQVAKLYNLPVYNPDSNISPIQICIFEQEAVVHALHNELLQHNILTGRILYPTVAKTAPRLRISLRAAHSKSDIQELCLHLHQALAIHG